MSSRLGISYCPTDVDNPYKKFDIYVPDSISADLQLLIVFVHGGAWRSEDKAQHADLAKRLVYASKLPVAVPNYRLTNGSDPNPFRHPGHALDLLEFLTFILNYPEPPSVPRKLVLIGHSCSAHMLCSVILDSTARDPVLTPSPNVLTAVQAVIMSEGIYSISKLVPHYPNYRGWFLEPTFGPNFEEFGVDTLSKRSGQRHPIRWLLIHSLDDDLVNLEQSMLMYDHLSGIDSGPVSKELSFHGSHNGILLTREYVSLVAQFVVENIA